MTDKKLTDAEIKRALECCAEGKGCSECGYSHKCDGTEHIKYALDLINRLQAENERLKKSNRNWRRKVQRLRAILAGDNK